MDPMGLEKGEMGKNPQSLLFPFPINCTLTHYPLKSLMNHN